MKKPNPYVAYFLLVLILTAGNACSGSSSRTTALASKDQVREGGSDNNIAQNQLKAIKLKTDGSLGVITGEWLLRGITKMCSMMSTGEFNKHLFIAVAAVHKDLGEGPIDEIVAALIKYVKANPDKIPTLALKKVACNVGHKDGVLCSVANKLKEKEISRDALCYLLHEIEKAVEEKKKQQSSIKKAAGKK